MANPSDSADSAGIPKAFGQYFVVRKIGDGGMGAVYEARHESLGKRVAIKTLLPEMAHKSELAARFMREGQAAARIRHPHVVDVYDVGSADGFTWLVMELLDGSDLDALLESKGRLSLQETIALMLPVISALAAAHREGVYHRDLKPANVFLSRDSIGRVHPKVVDFGISKIVEDGTGFDLTRSAAVLGTPYYMAPEQVHSIKKTDARSDQYSLGVILYECLTGQRPFSGESLFELMTAITTKDATRPDLIVDSIPPAVCDAIIRAMRREPSERFASVRELGTSLYPFADELTRALWASEFGSDSVDSLSSSTKAQADCRTAARQTVEKANTLESFESEVRLGSDPAAGVRRSRRRLALVIGIAAASVLGVVVTVAVLPRQAPQALIADSASSTVAAAPQSAPALSLSGEDAATAPAASGTPAASASAEAPRPAEATAPSGAKPAPARTASQGRSSDTATASPPSPARTGDGAVRGANSAWIIR